MDDLDNKLIALLRHDARTPIATIAMTLNISRATAKARIDKLVSTGVIAGFTIITGSPSDDKSIHAIALIEIGGRTTEGVVKALMGMPQVRSLHTTNGKWDLIAELETTDLIEFDDILRRIRLIEGVSLTETNILLAPKKSKLDR
jgi:DNA-binding Lrp family transcriptional regulator